MFGNGRRKNHQENKTKILNTELETSDFNCSKQL